MLKLNAAVAAIIAMTLSSARSSFAEDKRQTSPRGQAEIEVGGKWVTEKDRTWYEGGKWIDVDYGRPIKRGRADLFGTGAEYGKKISGGAPVWRTGANQTTRLKTEVGLEIAGKKIAPGEYDLFVELKNGAWTLVVSTQPAQTKYDNKNKSAIWGSYGYDPKFDVVRAPMTKFTPPFAVEEFTISFADASESEVKLAMVWDKEGATATFKIAK